MAVNRGTRKATFAYLFELFAILGTLGGAGFGIFDALGETPFDLLMNAFRYGIFGFLGGSAVGIIFGAIAVVFATIFR